MLPAKMNLVDIVVRQLLHEETQWDPDFEEPVGDKQRTQELTLRGQPNLGENRAALERRTSSLTGDKAESRGHIVFRIADLEAAGVQLAKGDQVVGIAGQAVDLLITEVRPESPLRESFLLLYAELEQRQDERASV